MKIGDFARLGQVSVRMLRHYDAIGLLVPDRVEEWSGHRDYAPEQLAALHRLLALKDLGLTLSQVGEVLRDDLAPEELRGMLRLRRSELEAEMDAARTRLAAVEHRLHLIELESTMPTTEYVVRSLEPRRIAALTDTVADGQTVAEVIEPLFNRASRALSAAAGCPETGVAVYDQHDQKVRLTAGYDVPADWTPTGAAADLAPIDLPAYEAVCGVHLGAMDGIGESWRQLHIWLEAHGYAPSGPCREVYLEAGDGPEHEAERTTAEDQAAWVTELQQPVVRR